jgi:anti-sigma B factor antagonist
MSQMTTQQHATFEVDTEAHENGTWRVRGRGELDVATASRLEAALDPLVDSGASLIALDLSEVSFLDSSGLRTIVRTATALEDAGGRLVIDGVSPAVSRVLEVTGLLERLRADAPADGAG